jgi:hypothetical protein
LPLADAEILEIHNVKPHARLKVGKGEREGRKDSWGKPEGLHPSLY